MINFFHHASDFNQRNKYCLGAATQLLQIQSDVTKIKFFSCFFTS